MDRNDACRVADADLERRFGGVARVYGAAGYARLRAAHVVVVGLGGVGSWAAEALARSAVGHLTLIDLDHVAESNTNRQVHALGDSYGKAKVTAMAERLLAINPALRVDCVEDFVSPENAATLIPPCAALLDCIDQVAAKAALIAACRARGIDVYASGAGGGRVDPTRIRSDDLARALGDPLLAKVRYRLRRSFGFPREKASASGQVRVPKFGVVAVYSDEPVRGPAHGWADEPVRGPAHEGADEPVRGTAPGAADASVHRLAHGGAPLACAGYGSVVTVTATLGFALAACALRKLTSAATSAAEAGSR